MQRVEVDRAAPSRWQALDRLRALAVLCMVQGHTFSALLRADALPAEVARWHALVHGLTAPAFLFGAGLAFGTATYGQYDRLRREGVAFRGRLRRYLGLLMLGYALQLQGGSLVAALHAGEDQRALICRVGPLQLVAVTLGLAQLALAVASTPRRHALLSAGLGLGVMLAATRVVRSDLSASLGPWLGAFVTDRGGAHFPVFPWAAFVLFGIGCAGLRHQRARALPAWWVGAAGALLAAGAYAVYRFAANQNDSSWWWRTSASYLLFRLGLVVLLIGALHRSCDGHAPRDEARPSSLLARHSLVAYVAHLLLLYGTPISPNLAASFGKSLSLAGAGAVSVAIASATLCITALWHWLEREQLLRTRYKRAGLVVLGLTLLVR